ncbi:Shikimate kinase [Candidatus Hepatincolaceae symbiont of Richtersius coronifer]
MVLILTGMPASGKSSIGKLLSLELKYLYIDLDKYIEKKTKTKIADIFSKKGEAFFRKIEHWCLKKILIENPKDMIFSLGGGTFINKINQDMCLKSGIVVWINTDLTIIYERVKNSNTRPLLNNSGSSSLQGEDLKIKLNILLQSRITSYNKAHLTINIHNNHIKQACAKILQLIKTHNF